MLKDVSREALKLARRLGEGKGGDAAEVDQRIATFHALTASGERLAATARSSLTQIERVAAEVLAVPLEDAGKIEDRPWTNWIAALAARAGQGATRQPRDPQLPEAQGDVELHTDGGRDDHDEPAQQV